MSDDKIRYQRLVSIVSRRGDGALVGICSEIKAAAPSRAIAGLVESLVAYRDWIGLYMLGRNLVQNWEDVLDRAEEDQARHKIQGSRLPDLHPALVRGGDSDDAGSGRRLRAEQVGDVEAPEGPGSLWKDR